MPLTHPGQWFYLVMDDDTVVKGVMPAPQEEKTEVQEPKFRIGEIVTSTQYNGEFVVLSCDNSGADTYCRLSKNGYEYCYRQDHLHRTGKMYDFGKHRFKKFYETGIHPSNLPTHSYKRDVVDFLSDQCFTAKLPYDLHFFWPNLERFGETGFLWIWPNADARMKGKAGRTKVKPGKFFRMLCSEDTTDQEIEELVEKFKEQFSEMSFTLHEGKKAEDFLKAYTHDRSRDLMFDTCSAYKRMCDSCMRYDTDHFNTEKHPVEAFASGDFGIFWLEDQFGKIAARVTWYDDGNKLQLGPIYATSLQAIDFLRTKLEDYDHSGIYQGDWEGAKLVLIEDSGIVGPYLDMAGNLTRSDCGKYLIIDDCGEIEHHHEGRYEESAKCECEWCHERVDSVTYVESVNRDVCESCLDCGFFVSEYDNEYYPESEMVEVFYSGGFTVDWAESQAEEHACMCEFSGEYWKEAYVTETLTGYVAYKYITSGDYVVCSVDGYAYPQDEMVETPTGPVAKCNYNEEEAA